MEIELGRVLDSLPSMVWTALPDGRIDFVNRRWSEYTGLDRTEAQGWEWQAAVNPDDLPRLLERWRSILACGEPAEMEARVRRADGQYRWFLVQCSPMRDDAGRLLKWYGANTEIDDRKRAEDALRDSERSLRSIVDGIPGLVAVFTAGGELELVNRQVLDFYGRTLDDLKRWGTGEMTHPEDLPRAIEVFTRSLASGDPFEMEVRALRFDGVYRWLQSRGFPVRGADGRIVRWYNLLIDVDERKRAEEGLRASETNLRLIIDSIPGMVCTMNAAGEVELLSKQVLDYFGKTSEDLKGWQFTDAVHPDDLPRVLTAFTHSVTSGDPYDIEHRCRRADGVYRWFQVRALPVRDADGRITGWYVVLVDIDDRRRAEDAVRASERNLQLTIDTIPVLVATYEPDGTRSSVNRTWRDYVGLTLEEATGAGATTFPYFHPDDVERNDKAWRASLASGEPLSIEVRTRRADGEYRWHIMRRVPFRDEQGNIVRWYSVGVDIDDQKRAEEALRESERYAQLIVDSIPGMVAIIAPSGEVEFVNNQLLEYCGIPEGDHKRWQSSEVVHPEDVPRAFEHFSRSIASGDPFDFEVRSRRFDGVYRWVHSRGAPLRDSSGRIVRWYNLLIDIDERKRAEEALRRSEAFLADAQRLSRTGSFVWRVGTEELVWSEETYRIYELDPATPVNFDIVRRRVHPDNLAHLQEVMAEVRRDGGDFDYETRLLMPDGSIKYLHVVAHSERDKDGQPELRGAVQDITERRLADEALSKARSELAHVMRITSLGALTASIAHEVNQPLSGIITNASTCLRMLAADPPNVDGALETARRTIRDGNRAADVIARLRALFSKRAPAIEPLDLNDAAREVIALSSGDLQRSRVMLRTELAERLPPVGGDRVQLQQVIMNLLRNAADAMSGIDDRPRRLLIRTERDEDDRVRLSVEDAGVGFGADSPERLFQAFYTTKSDGMGIGLSISRSIVESHNGRLWAQANDGPGATFFFSIPSHSGDEMPIHHAGAPARSNARNAAGIS